MVENALIDWSRAQFALTACYHWIFVPLTLGLSVIVAVMESIYVARKDEFWKKTAKFWMKLFAINFAVGIATGIILEFEFGTNWSNYSWFVGDIFGAPLAIEGILAFFMEATFFAVMFFGWNKVSRKFHLASTWLTCIGASVSALWILVANAWMQHPVGMEFNPDTVRNEMTDFWAVALNPVAVSKFFHSVLSGWMTGAIFVIGVSCWYLLKGRETRFAKASIRVASIVGIAGTLAVMFSGDSSAVHVAKYQPMKLAAAEGLEDGGKRAPFSIVPGVEIPGMLSILATHDIDGYVPGINDLLDGYTDSDGNAVLSADEKKERGDIALLGNRHHVPRRVEQQHVVRVYVDTLQIGCDRTGKYHGREVDLERFERLGQLGLVRLAQRKQELLVLMLYDQLDKSVERPVGKRNLAFAVNDVFLKIERNGFGRTDVLHGLGHRHARLLAYAEEAVDGCTRREDHGRMGQYVDALAAELFR